MQDTKNNNPQKKYIKFGIVAAVVVAIALIGVSLVGGSKNVSADEAIAEVSADAPTGGELRFAIVRMDAIQSESKALQDLRNQKEKYENQLRKEMEKEQKDLEKEKADIEKSQDVLSREALQRRVVEYQGKIAKLQRDLTERAQAVEVAFQKALAEIQEKHLDPIIDAIITKKNLSLVIDGRFARTGANIGNLDITNDVVNALNKKVSNVKMDKPKGF